MSRFSHLEFDETPARPILPGVPEPKRWPDQDEHACLATGDDLFRTGRYEPALLAYSRALRFNRDRVEAWVGQIRCLLCLGEYPEALVWSQRAQERFPQSADILACKGLALAHTGSLPEGTEYLDGAVGMRSPSPFVWLARGEGLLLSRHAEENAHRCFAKALELAPKDAHLELRIGIAYNRARLYARARASLQAAVHGDDRNPLALYELARTLEGLGERDAADGLYARALAVRPDYEAAANARDRIRNGGLVARLGAQFRRWRG